MSELKLRYPYSDPVHKEIILDQREKRAKYEGVSVEEVPYLKELSAIALDKYINHDGLPTWMRLTTTQILRYLGMEVTDVNKKEIKNIRESIRQGIDIDDELFRKVKEILVWEKKYNENNDILYEWGVKAIEDAEYLYNKYDVHKITVELFNEYSLLNNQKQLYSTIDYYKHNESTLTRKIAELKDACVSLHLINEDVNVSDMEVQLPDVWEDSEAYDSDKKKYDLLRDIRYQRNSLLTLDQKLNDTYRLKNEMLQLFKNVYGILVHKLERLKNIRNSNYMERLVEHLQMDLEPLYSAFDCVMLNSRCFPIHELDHFRYEVFMNSFVGYYKLNDVNEIKKVFEMYDIPALYNKYLVTVVSDFKYKDYIDTVQIKRVLDSLETAVHEYQEIVRYLGKYVEELKNKESLALERKSKAETKADELKNELLMKYSYFTYEHPTNLVEMNRDDLNKYLIKVEKGMSDLSKFIQKSISDLTVGEFSYVFEDVYNSATNNLELFTRKINEIHKVIDSKLSSEELRTKMAMELLADKNESELLLRQLSVFDIDIRPNVLDSDNIERIHAEILRLKKVRSDIEDIIPVDKTKLAKSYIHRDQYEHFLSVKNSMLVEIMNSINKLEDTVNEISKRQEEQTKNDENDRLVAMSEISNIYDMVGAVSIPILNKEALTDKLDIEIKIHEVKFAIGVLDTVAIDKKYMDPSNKLYDLYKPIINRIEEKKNKLNELLNELNNMM